MPPSLKNPLRVLISRLLPMSVTKNFLGSDADNVAAPLFNLCMAIIIWVEFAMALLRPWNSESKDVWRNFLGYRIDKAYLCKNRSGNEHEFVVVDLSTEHNQNLRLRIERTVSERKSGQPGQPSSPSSSSTSFESSSDVSSPPSRPASPNLYQRRSSLSISTMNEGLSKATNSLRRVVRRLSDSSLLYPSRISSSGHVAADTVMRIDAFPKKAKIVRIIDFTSAERSQRPSLWDLMILSYVIHRDNSAYDLLDRQCFWFADAISAGLEKWSERCKGVLVKQMAKAQFLRSNTTTYPSSGTVKGVPIHRRNQEGIDKIWVQFLKQKEGMDKQRQSYENIKIEEARKAEELVGQVEELIQQQVQERRNWEVERKELEERERRLMKEQEGREDQLKQQIVEQECTRHQLQQELRENDRRFQEIEKKFKSFDCTKD